MSLSPTDIIKNAAKHAENEGRTGYDAVSDTWYSHPSPEGGLATIGFGHKGASSDEVASWGIGGMTDEQVSASFDSDWDEATQIAANQYNAAYEDSFSDLPEIGQALLSEIAFNVGRVTNKKGKFGWPSLVRAIKEDDVAGIKKEINRTYTDSDGVAHPMDRRVGFLRDAIDEASDEGAPAPSGEDVGSIEALPDSYSHKIGDFFAGLMGGDQPTRNRRTQTISGLTDWSTKKPQEFNTGGMVGMMTPTLEVIVGHDEESGNPIPAGSTDKEVRDDVEALLSEGEYVLPADVVRWHGLKHIQEMRDEAKCGLMCMSMDGQIKTPESDEAYEEPSDDEDVEVTEEGNEIEIVDNTDEKKIKAADGGLIEGSTEEGDSEEPASLGYLVRRLVRGPSGRMEVRYFDPETGMYVDDPTGYEVLDQNAYNSLNGAGMTVSGDDSGDDTAAEEVIDEAGSTSGGGGDRDSEAFEAPTQVERNMATDYGFEDPNKLVTMGAGLLGGPLIGGAVRFGQSYNNAEAVDAAREDLGMEGLSWWDKVKGGFSGKYNNGAIGRDAIGEKDYTAGFGGRVYEDEHGNMITTLTPNEWKKRTEAQDIDISTLPSAFDNDDEVSEGIMSSPEPTFVEDTILEKEDAYVNTTPEYEETWDDEVEMDSDFSWWDDADTDDVVVSAAPHAEISGGNTITQVDPVNEYYADLYGEEGRSTQGLLSPVIDTSDEFYEDQIVREAIFQRDVLENDLPPAPSNDSDNSSSSSSNNSSSSKDRDNNSSSSSSGGGWTQKTKQEVDDSLDYAENKYGFLATGGR